MVDLRMPTSGTDGAVSIERSRDSNSNVVVAVLTYQRTEILPDTIAALLTECIDVERAGVLVIDNNPAGDAWPTVRALMDRARPQRLRYVHERTPGIAAARNRALHEARGARILIFIDDDELPRPGWIAALLLLHDERAPTAIAGPVVSEFSSAVDPWITAGRFFMRRRMPSGSTLTVAATNNLLLDIAQVRALGLAFDPRFGLTGGEDTLFTRQLVRRGGSMLWCDEAIVIDRVPSSRLSRQWVLRKDYSTGNTRVRVDVALAGTAAARAMARLHGAVGGTARLTFGVLRAGLGAVTRNTGHQALGARAIAKGVGMVLGAVGYTYRHYARPSDTSGGHYAQEPEPDRVRT